MSGSRHHLVPRFYLQNFADERSQQVVLVDRDDPARSHLNHTKNACAEVGYYRIKTDLLERAEDRAKHDPEIIEKLLGRFEHAAAPAIDKLVRRRGDLFSKDDWFHLVNFIALQTVRGARWRQDFNAAATQEMRRHLGKTVTDDEIRGWLIEEGRPAQYSDIIDFRRDMLGNRGPRLIAPQAVIIQEGFQMALSGIAERLADRRRWEFIEPERVGVLTADEPVCWWSPGDGPVGYGNAPVVWLPLSRNLILQICDAKETNKSLGLPRLDGAGGSDELASIVNREIAGQAERWIVHHPDDSPLDSVQIPTRTEWTNELIDVSVDGNQVREQYIHRRRPRRRIEE